jgi:hypothetical protein
VADRHGTAVDVRGDVEGKPSFVKRPTSGRDRSRPDDAHSQQQLVDVGGVDILDQLLDGQARELEALLLRQLAAEPSERVRAPSTATARSMSLYFKRRRLLELVSAQPCAYERRIFKLAARVP